MKLVAIALALVLISLPATLIAQDEDYTLRHQDADGNADPCIPDVDETLELYLVCDFADGGDMQGYQWGVCHDGDIVSLADGDVTNGSHTDDSDDGGAAISFTFEAVTVIDETDEWGWTVGALLNVITEDVIEPTDDAELYCVTYTAEDFGESSIEFCETLGSPAVTVQLVVDSDEVEPVQETSEVVVDCGSPLPFTYSMGGFDEPLEEMFFDGKIYVFIGGDGSTETQGFQMSIGFDTAVLSVVEPDDEEDLLEPVLASMNDGDGPAFFGPDFDPDGGGGMTVGVVYDLFGEVTQAFDEEPNRVFSFDVDWIDDDVDEVELTFDEALGDPPLVNQVVVDGDGVEIDEAASIGLTLKDVVIGQPLSWVSGDLDGDGVLTVFDAILIIEYLFQDGGAICEEAAASLEDPTDEMNTGDILFILNFAYLDGPDPGGDYPDCTTMDCDPSDYCY